MDKKTLRSYLLVLLAATCWGTTGLGNRMLTSASLSQGQLVLTRIGIAFIAITIILLIKGDKDVFRIKLRDLWCFLGTGIVSLLLFSYSYFNAMQLMSLSAAAVLLYLAPMFVVILSAILFKEPVTPGKLVALVLVLLGACLSTGLIGSGSSGVHISGLGLLFGVISGLGYALYSIFSRYALQRGYSSLTITFYTFLFATLGSLFIADVPGLIAASHGAKVIFWELYMGIVTCLLPYLFYTKGLEGVENGRASIVATWELVVATLVSVLLFHEAFGWASLLGIILVLAGIAIMNVGRKPDTADQRR